MNELAPFRTTITTIAGLVALVWLGHLQLTPEAVSILSLAVVGVCGGQAARSGAEAVARARAGKPAELAAEVVKQVRSAARGARDPSAG